MTQPFRPSHDWQCPWHLDQYPSECECGVTRPRRPWMDLFPLHRPPTQEESDAAHQKIQEMGL